MCHWLNIHDPTDLPVLRTSCILSYGEQAAAGGLAAAGGGRAARAHHDRRGDLARALPRRAARRDCADIAAPGREARYEATGGDLGGVRHWRCSCCRLASGRR